MAGIPLAADPRTATPNNSIWRGMTERTFQQHVCRLWKHTNGRPKDPIVYAVPARKNDGENVLPIAIEIELAEGFAFVAAVKKGVESVSAVAIAIPKNRLDGLMVYIASNVEVRPNTKEKFKSMVSSIRGLASRDISKDECKDQILTTILVMNSGHINARLKSNRKARPIVLEGLQEILVNSVRPRREARNLTTLEARLASLCQSLRQYAKPSKPTTSMNDLKRLVVACHSFWSAPGLESTKDMLVRAGVDIDETRGNPHLRQIAKIAAYYHISAMIVATASQTQYEQLFRYVAVQYVRGYSPVQVTIPKDIAGGGDHCRVHAEVQLIVELDMVKQSKWQAPRVIGSSKAACFLCDSFIQKHGVYFVPRSHGKLTPFWTAPDLNQFNKAQRGRYHNIIRDISRELHELARMSHPQRLDPAMSWQVLSRLNVLQASRASSRLPTPTPSVRSIFAPSVLGHVMGKQSSASRLAIASHQGSKATITKFQVDTSPDDRSSASSEDICSLETLPKKLTHKQHCSGDFALETHTAGTGSITDAGIEESTQNLPMQREPQQIRSFKDLNCKQRQASADIMGDHESRMCNVLPAHSALGTDQPCISSASYSISTSRKLDFHDLELFFEVERPTTANILVLPGQEPRTSQSRVVDVAKLVPGDELEVDFSADRVKERIIFLEMQDRMKEKRWFKLTWQNVVGDE